MEKTGPVLMVAVMLAAPAPALAERPAELSAITDQTCVFPTGTFKTTSSVTYAFDLPEESGLVTAEAKIELQTPGMPSVFGTSTMKARVENDAALIVTELLTIWPYGGPSVETGELVRIQLEPDRTLEVPFDLAEVPDTHCFGTTHWTLRFSRERQHWAVTLLGIRRLTRISEYPAFVPDQESWIWLHHEFGFAFEYRLGADVTLVRRQGKWEFEEAKVTRAVATARYEQDPQEFYRVIREYCPGCRNVRALVGATLAGKVEDGKLWLFWRDLQPVATVEAVFAYQCAPGEFQAQCERHRREESSYSDVDNRTFAAAHDTPLALRDGIQSFEPEFSKSKIDREELKLQYELKRKD